VRGKNCSSVSHFNQNALLTVCTGSRTGAPRVEACSLSDKVAKTTTFSYILNTFDCFSSPNFVFIIFHLFQSKIEPREAFLELKWATSNVIAVLGQFWGEVITWCLVHVQKAVKSWCEDQTKIHYGSRSNNYHQGEPAILFGVGWGGVAKYSLNNKTGPFLEFNRWKKGFSWQIAWHTPFKS